MANPVVVTPEDQRQLEPTAACAMRETQKQGRHCWFSRTSTRSSGHARVMRDRAIVYVLLSTGLRREELVMLDLGQVRPREPGLLRSGRG